MYSTRKQWRDAYRNARLQRTIERRHGLGLLSTTLHPVVFFSHIDAVAAVASMRPAGQRPRDVLSRRHCGVAGPVGLLP